MRQQPICHSSPLRQRLEAGPVQADRHTHTHRGVLLWQRQELTNIHQVVSRLISLQTGSSFNFHQLLMKPQEQQGSPLSAHTDHFDSSGLSGSVCSHLDLCFRSTLNCTVSVTWSRELVRVRPHLVSLNRSFERTLAEQPVPLGLTLTIKPVVF